MELLAYLSTDTHAIKYTLFTNQVSHDKGSHIDVIPIISLLQSKYLKSIIHALKLIL